MNRTPEQEAWADRARSRDVLDVAKALGIAVKRSNQGVPCPLCGGDDRFSVSRPKQIAHCRNCGTRDAIALVMDVKHYTFPEACEWLTGEPDPKGKPSKKVAETGNRPAKLAAAKSKDTRDRESEAHRREEIEKARAIWEGGQDAAGTILEQYHAARGLTFSPHWPLKFAPEQPYWHTWKDDDEPTLLYTGPAQLAAITDDKGVLTGCHITWFNPDEPGAKIKLSDKDKPGKFLPAKKVRGSKRRAAIRLTAPRGAAKLVMGEGIETTLSVYEVFRGGFAVAGMAFWAGIDLGHMGGKSAKSIPHPTDKNEKTGRPIMVKGPFWEPEPERDLIVPDTVRELILLGDGDSEPFATEMALRRAAARFELPGRVVKVAWAPSGADFNDVLLGKAA